MFPCPHGRTPRCPRCPRLAPVLSACLSRSLQPALVLFLGSYPAPQGVSSTGFWDHSLREQPTSTDVLGKDFLECRCHFRDSIYSLHIDSLIGQCLLGMILGGGIGAKMIKSLFS